MFLRPAFPRFASTATGRLARLVALHGVAVLGVAVWVLGPLVTSASVASAAVATTTSAVPPTSVVSPTDAVPETDTTVAKADAASSTKGFVDVIDVSGYVDPVMRNFILRSIEDAVGHDAEALVIQLNSPGSLLPRHQLDALVKAITNERRVPITVWVGGYKARAKGGAARLVTAAAVVGIASGTHVGEATAVPAGGDDRLVGHSYTREQALKAKVAQIDAPVLVQFVGLLDGRTVNGRTLDTAQDVKGADGVVHPKPFGVRFAKLGLVPRLLHTATNPSIAYFLFVVALALFVFEFFTGGVGVAAGVGLLAFVMAASGFGNLPTRPLGLALLVLSMFGFAVDVQAGTPRFWTGVGTVSLVAGSLALYAQDTHVPIYWIAAVTVMVVLFMVNGMPTMVRTRFATPTIGREGMIGELGEARDAIAPEGVVIVRGGPWRARTNRATPIGAGDPVRVIAIDGLLLEVEPLEGAAKDAGH